MRGVPYSELGAHRTLGASLAALPAGFPVAQVKCARAAQVVREWAAKHKPPLCKSVSDVVALCAEKKVRGVNARRNIAAMQDRHAARDFAVKQDPCGAVPDR